MNSAFGVFFEQRRVGTLEADEGRMRFSYASDWIADPAAFPISLSIPLQSEVFEQPAHRFFANLLPEGRVRSMLARRLGLSEANDVQILARIGAECAGALSVLRSGETPDTDAWSYRPLDPNEVVRLTHGAGVLASLAGTDNIRLSLAGAQDKLPVLLRDDRLWLPENGAPSSHILKVPNRDFKHLPDNELFVTALAGRCGLPVIQAERFDVAGMTTALMARYDRRAGAGPFLQRIHQEDCCQALGMPAHLKYEADGGNPFSAIYRVVRDAVLNPLADSGMLLRWLVFCVLSGNADGHAKNLSLLMDGPVPRLAPFYDLVCTQAYPIVDKRLAFAVGGERNPGQVGRAHWQVLAADVGVGERFVLNLVAELADTVLDAVDALAAETRERHGELPVLQTVTQPIRKQCRRTLTLLKPRK